MTIDPVRARALRWIVAAGLLAATLAIGIGIGGPHARLAQFVLMFAWSLYLTCILPGTGRSVALTICSLTFGLVVLEGVAVVVETTPPRTIADGSLYTDRPDLGWGPSRPGAFPVQRIAGDGHVIYDATYTIDNALLRHTGSAIAGHSTIFLGDSFTFGDGVDDADTMPQAYADLGDRASPVLNLGYSGYGPSQALRTLQTGLFDKQFGTPDMFVLTTAAWHVERTGCLADFSLRGPRYVWDGRALSYAGACAPRASNVLRAYLANTAFYRVFLATRLAPRPSGADFETYVRVIADIARLARERYGASLVVAYLRDPYYLIGKPLTDDEIVQRLDALGVEVIDATLPARADLVIAGDGHPTPAANRMRAKMLIDALHPAAPLQR